jgi:uncharacterized membrane protein HdeD (DUF308 family)
MPPDLTPTELSIQSLHLIGLDELKKRWGWFLALGILLVLLGTIAVGSSVAFTLASMWFIGCLMIFGGILQGSHAFMAKRWGGFFMDLLLGLLYVVVGMMVVANPVATAVDLTLLIAMFLIFGGTFRIALAFSIRFHHALWLVIHGVISVLLGILIWNQWPASGLWVIGLFIGIDMIFNGWSLIMLGVTAKSLPHDPPLG